MKTNEKIEVCITKILKLMDEDQMFNNRTMFGILKTFEQLKAEIEDRGNVDNKTYLKLIKVSEHISIIADKCFEKFEKMILKATKLGDGKFVSKVQKLWTRLGDVKLAALDCVKTNEMNIEQEL